MAYTRVNWQNNISTPINATKLNIMDAGIDNHEGRITTNESTLTTHVTALKDGNFTKSFDIQYKGAELYFPYTQGAITGGGTIGTYQSIIDALVADNCNTVSINPRMSMATQTSNTMTRMAVDADVLGAFQYAKSKGLKTMLKCHVSGASGSQYQINPTDTVAWINDWTSHVMYYVNLLNTNNCLPDLVSLINEAINQTSGNSTLWQNLHNSIKAVSSNIKTVSASTRQELSASVLYDIVDYIGCNLYVGVGGTDASNIYDLKPKMFRDINDGVNWISTLQKLARAKGKKIIITEVGCLPYNSGLSTPANWNGSGGVSQAAQDLYYKIALGTFLNCSNMAGIFIWDTTDDFTFIGRQAESTVRTLFGGGS